MNGGNFTHKAQEAMMLAQSIAQKKGQQQIDALHIFSALLSQEESVILTLLQKLEVDTESLKKKAEKALDGIPTTANLQSFGQFYLTQDMAKVLENATQESIKMGDEFISVEHLFLALLITETKAKEILDQICVKSLADLKPDSVDWVDLFVNPTRLTALIDDIIKLAPKLVWCQIGVVNDEFNKALDEANIPYITDVCPKIEWGKHD